MNPVKSFLDKYNALLIQPGANRPDYTCKLSTVARLVEIANQLAASYKSASEADRGHIARDLSGIQFELNVRFAVALKKGEFDETANRGFMRLIAIHLGAGIKCRYLPSDVWAEVARR
jgi:hypothetical protein